MNNAFNDMLKPILNSLPRLLPGNAFSIGLDLGPDRINMVQMERANNGISIRAIASVPFACTRDELYQNPQTLKTALSKAYESQPFKGKRVVSCLPAEHVKIITLSYQHVEGQPDSVPIVAELKERFHQEIHEMVIDFMVLRQDDSESGRREALVAMAPRKKIMAYLDLLTGAGLQVDALDIGPAALGRLVRHAGALHTPEFPLLPNVLLINFGAEASFLSAVWGRRLMLDRAVEFSENRMLVKLKQVLGMQEALAMHLLYEQTDPHDDSNDNRIAETEKMIEDILRPEISALIQEINKTLVYMASKTRGKSADKIYLAGRAACYPGMLKSLQAQLNVPVTLLNPLSVFAADDSTLAADSHLGTMAGIAMTTGLALRGVPEHG